MLLTRALFDLLFTLDETAFEGLKFLLVGGEALTKTIMMKLRDSSFRPEHVINAYGPTENSTFCTTYAIKDDFSMYQSVPIGRPYSNRVAYLLDKHLQLMPIGIPGEIYVGGSSLSRGYLNQPELTAERFIANPIRKRHPSEFESDSESDANPNRYYSNKIYKTGDLAKWLANENLEYIGRNDFQVKLRGYRIELGEIETRLLEIPGIKHSVVLMRKYQGLDHLVGYYVSESKIEADVLKKHLAVTLPEHMIPSIFQHLITLPVTSNGKLDRNALPEPKLTPEAQPKQELKESEHTAFEFAYAEASLEKIETTLYNIWSEILNRTHFGKQDSFFNLGGNSLAAMMVRNKLENAFKLKLSIVALFQHTTIRQLAGHIMSLLGHSKTTESSENLTKSPRSDKSEPIAIVGMACRLPGVKDVNDFWKLLLEEKSNLREFSIEELRAHNIDKSVINAESYVKRGAVFEDAFEFDAGFFGYSLKEAEMMDPQQRLFLECAFEALENSGNVPDKFKGDIGVFASQGRNYYYPNNVLPNHKDMSGNQIFQTILSNEKDFLSTRVSYKLNLTGPSITLQTACSSSLVSVQMACESLKSGGCDMALAGGVSLFYNYGYPYQEEMIESPDGYCRAFDSDAKGTVVTSGVGSVVLKRLSDAIAHNDTIYALIKGGAVNNDGSSKVGFTAPSVKGQMAVIERAMKSANVSPEDISYIEAHGTGTAVGDPIEWTALHEVYQKHVKEPESCVIGALKTNIGHTDSAAGVMGLIKTTLALQNKILPATLNFRNLNPEIASFNKIFRVSNKTMPWDRKLDKPNSSRRIAAISSFGLGGTNAHMILEEFYDDRFKKRAKGSSNEAVLDQERYYLIPFSAKTKDALAAMAQNMRQALEICDSTIIPDFAYTAQEGRSEFEARGFLICNRFGIRGERLIFQYLRETEFEEKKIIISSREEAKSYINIVPLDIMADNISSGDPISYMVQLRLIGWMWSNGAEVLWENLRKEAEQAINHMTNQTTDRATDQTTVEASRPLNKIPIPGYHFIRKRFEMATNSGQKKQDVIEHIPEHQIENVAEQSISLQAGEQNLTSLASSPDRSFTEPALKEIWTKTLGVPMSDISASSDFFALGGDSLSLIDLFSLIKKSFFPSLDLEDIVNCNEFGKMYQFLATFSR